MAVHSKIKNSRNAGVIDRRVVLSSEGRKAYGKAVARLDNGDTSVCIDMNQKRLYDFIKSHQECVCAYMTTGYGNFGRIIIIRGGNKKAYELLDEYFDLAE